MKVIEFKFLKFRKADAEASDRDSQPFQRLVIVDMQQACLEDISNHALTVNVGLEFVGVKGDRVTERRCTARLHPFLWASGVTEG